MKDQFLDFGARSIRQRPLKYYVYASRYISSSMKYWPMPVAVAARSKAWVCSRSFAGVAGSNTARGMDVCVLGALCVFR